MEIYIWCSLTKFITTVCLNATAFKRKIKRKQKKKKFQNRMFTLRFYKRRHLLIDSSKKITKNNSYLMEIRITIPTQIQNNVKFRR